MWGLPWGVVQRMLIDQPVYKPSENGGKKVKRTLLTEENSDEFLKHFSQFGATVENGND